ncbi:MAG: hypothetical protein ACPG44_01650 [Polaribacter sp.]
MKKLPNGKNAEALAKQVNAMLLPYKDFVFSITSDNGTEFAKHKKNIGSVILNVHIILVISLLNFY